MSALRISKRVLCGKCIRKVVERPLVRRRLRGKRGASRSGRKGSANLRLEAVELRLELCEAGPANKLALNALHLLCEMAEDILRRDLVTSAFSMHGGVYLSERVLHCLRNGAFDIGDGCPHLVHLLRRLS